MLIIPIWVTLMLTIITITIIITSFVILLSESQHEMPIIKFLAIVIPPVLSGILILIMAFGGTPIYEEEYGRTVNLYALDSDNGLTGTFLLGSGTIQNIQYYIGYINIEEDDYKQIKFDASNSVLRLKDDETPRAEIYKEYKFMKYFNLILLETMYSSEKSILYIPRDGLKNEYSVNYWI